jgi:8-oxo-dGTP pyrophosphatase MutT (NUDIX family)
MNMNNSQCSNCHKTGHLYKDCNEPHTSYGIICYCNIDGENKLILIRRRDTIGFIEFLRGKYEPHDEDYIVQLMNMMTTFEKELIKNHKNFDELRNAQGMTRENTINMTEYNNSQKKYNQLILGNRIDSLLEQSVVSWDTPEWGIPKGRKNPRESPKCCAVREFYEETGLTDNDITLHSNIKPLEEVYTGINGIQYKHIYYFAKYINDNRTLSIDPDNFIQTIEISDIMWGNFQMAFSMIRPYHKDKINIIKKALQILKSKDKYFTEIENCISIY